VTVSGKSASTSQVARSLREEERHYCIVFQQFISDHLKIEVALLSKIIIKIKDYGRKAQPTVPRNHLLMGHTTADVLVDVAQPKQKGGR
jgi:hypothetical protein